MKQGVALHLKIKTNGFCISGLHTTLAHGRNVERRRHDQVSHRKEYDIVFLNGIMGLKRNHDVGMTNSVQ